MTVALAILAIVVVGFAALVYAMRRVVKADPGAFGGDYRR
jgi:hypothetical protein